MARSQKWLERAETEARSVLEHFGDEIADNIRRTGKPLDKGTENAIETRINEYVELHPDTVESAEIVDELGATNNPERGLWDDEKAKPAELIRNMGGAVFLQAVRNSIYRVLEAYKRLNTMKGETVEDISEELNGLVEVNLNTLA